jgi:hypothetical protein
MALDDMPRINVDPHLAERLIDGRASAADVPADTAAVAHVLGAARRAATESDDAAMATTVAAMRAVLAPEGTAAALPPRLRRVASPIPRILAAGAAGLAVLFGGLAAAGALPAGAQKPVADFVSHVGIDLPGDTKPAENPAAVTTTTTSTTSTTIVLGEPPVTAAPTSETTVTAPACPPPSYEGPNGCITPLPVPVPPTTTPPTPPTTTTTQKPPPPPTTTTSTTVPDGGGQAYGGRGRFDG